MQINIGNYIGVKPFLTKLFLLLMFFLRFHITVYVFWSKT